MNKPKFRHKCKACESDFHSRKKDSGYCSRQCAWSKNGGQNRKSSVWWKNSRGYIEGRVWINGRECRFKQHRWVMMLHLGREILPHEDVHHINGDKSDNRIENLEILTHGAHSVEHNKKRTYKRGYKLILTKEEIQNRSERAAMGHKTGRLKTPQARAALARARGEGK